MSTDSTRDLVQKFILDNPNYNIRLLDNPGILSSCARNIGIRESKGQLIGVIDGHVFIPDNQLFKNMDRYAKKNGALCLSRPAPLDVPGLSRRKPYWIAVARKTWLGHSKNSYIYKNFEGFVDPVSSGFAYDRIVFSKIGFFDESFDAAEDVEFHYRLKKEGIMAYTSPSLTIYSYPRESFLALFNQQVRYGVGRAQFVRKHPEGLTIETFIPVGIFLLFCLSPLITIFLLYWRTVPLLFISLIPLYLTILIFTGIMEAVKRKNFFSSFLIAFGIFITHIGLGFGFLKTMVKQMYPFNS